MVRSPRVEAEVKFMNKLTTVPQSQSATKPSALGAMAKRLNVETDKLMNTLQSTCFKGASPEQMLALVVVANEYGLNPFLKEIYAFPAKGGGIVPVVGVDGWVKMVNRSDAFDGVEFDFAEDSEGFPIACTCTLYLKNRTRPVKITEYFSECARKTEPWENMPRRMLRHKALIQAARVGFGFSGIQDEDEAKDYAVEIEPAAPDVRKISINSPAQPAAPKENVREEFQKLLEENQIPFTAFQKWCEGTGAIANADSLASLGDVPDAELKRLLRLKATMLPDLIALKG